MSGLSLWWQGRSNREQILLATMFALLVAMVTWYGIWQPLVRAQARAEVRLEQAVMLDRGVSARIKAWQAEAPKAQGPGAPVSQLVSEAATAAGFQPSRAQPQGMDAISLDIPAAKSRALFQWLLALEHQGVFVDQANLTTKSDGTIAASLILRKASR